MAQTKPKTRPASVHNDKCRALHFGPWMIEPDWFTQAVEMVRSGTISAENPMPDDPDDDPNAEPDFDPDDYGSIAVVKIEGAMMKARSKFGGTCSTVDCRAAIRQAVNDDGVKAILLLIDSPGGTVAGLDSLAQDVSAANQKKPVYAHIEDLCASAAYYVASQCTRITAARTSLVGCLGSMMAVTDSSGAAAMAGLKVHTLTTGGMKGAGTPGTEITPEQLKYYQGIVDQAGGYFKAAVMQGRKMSKDAVDAVFDGRVFDAQIAQELGLIDQVASVDAAMSAITQEVNKMTDQEVLAKVTESPQLIAHIVDKASTQARAESKSFEIARAQALYDAAPGRPAIAMKAFIEGQTVESVKITVKALDESDAQHKAELAEANKKTAEAEAAARLAQEQAALAGSGQKGLKMGQGGGGDDADKALAQAKSEGRYAESEDGKIFKLRQKWH